MSHELVMGPHGLNALQCVCGREKRQGQTFCYTCFQSLPSHLKPKLYRRIGEGYEGAYAEAVEFLRLKGRVK